MTFLAAEVIPSLNKSLTREVDMIRIIIKEEMMVIEIEMIIKNQQDNTNPKNTIHTTMIVNKDTKEEVINQNNKVSNSIPLSHTINLTVEMIIVIIVILMMMITMMIEIKIGAEIEEVIEEEINKIRSPMNKSQIKEMITITDLNHPNTRVPLNHMKGNPRIKIPNLRPQHSKPEKIIHQKHNNNQAYNKYRLRHRPNRNNMGTMKKSMITTKMNIWRRKET